MKTIKVDFTSDLHVDFWIKEKQSSRKLTKLVTEYINDILKPQGGDILVLAGDLGHYFTQDTEVLRQLKTIYSRVILVRGNHDMYLVSTNQRNIYKSKSSNRVQEMKDWCLSNEVDYLDGDIIDIDGFRIGGVGMWYNLPTPGTISQWNEVMNDSNLIIEGHDPIRFQYGYGASYKESQWDTQEYYESELTKLKAMRNLDLLVTHVPPVCIPEELKGVYAEDRNSIFYETDNIEAVKKTGTETVISGHVHGEYSFETEGIQLLIYPVGYRFESSNSSIHQVELFK